MRKRAWQRAAKAAAGAASARARQLSPPPRLRRARATRARTPILALRRARACARTSTASSESRPRSFAKWLLAASLAPSTFSKPRSTASTRSETSALSKNVCAARGARRVAGKRGGPARPPLAAPASPAPQADREHRGKRCGAPRRSRAQRPGHAPAPTPGQRAPPWPARGAPAPPRRRRQRATTTTPLQPRAAKRAPSTRRAAAETSSQRGAFRRGVRVRLQLLRIVFAVPNFCAQVSIEVVPAWQISATIVCTQAPRCARCGIHGRYPL